MNRVIVSDELAKICKKAVVLYCKVLFQLPPREAEEKYAKSGLF
jgi:hypothetical protein